MLSRQSYQNVSRETFLSGRGRKPYKTAYAARPLDAWDRAEIWYFRRLEGSALRSNCAWPIADDRMRILLYKIAVTFNPNRCTDIEIDKSCIEHLGESIGQTLIVLYNAHS
jgi:hypothetical protein